MATLTLTNSYEDDWPPDVFAGGAITTRSATVMTYISAQGYTITLRGNGLTYDDDGMPASGTVTRVVVTGPSGTYSTFTGVSADFGMAGMKIFGFDRDNGDHDGPDPFNFFLNLMRGNDLVNGSAFDDDIRSGMGNDSINGGAGGDYIGDEQGNDSMDGGADFDSLSYDEANWRPDAFRGVNLDAATGIAIDCFGFTDHFSNFERFKDSVFSDTLLGSAADEQFVINRGNDVVDGREGWDVLDYSQTVRWGAHRGVNVNLDTGLALDSWKNTDLISNIEEVRGSAFNDTLTGSARDEEFQGRSGVDAINGGGGFDHLAFWDSGENGVGHGVVINTTRAANIRDDGYGNVETALGIESFGGTRFADSFLGGAESNRFNGDDGNDTLNGGGGEDFLDGGWGSDSIAGGVGGDHLSGGGDNDTLTGNAGADDFNFNWNLADSGVDTISDMQVGLDEIWIGSWWGGLSGEFLAANQFRSGAGVTTANSANQRVIYNTTTGDLYFDADGNGTGFAAVRFATLANHAAITSDDFHIFL
jgi:serralysin